MEVLLGGLSAKSIDNQSIKLLVSSRYHCELADEGVEYVWGMTKRFYQSCALDKKNTKHNINKIVRSSIEHVNKNKKIFSKMPTIYDGLLTSFERRRIHTRNDRALREDFEDALKHW